MSPLPPPRKWLPRGTTFCFFLNAMERRPHGAEEAPAASDGDVPNRVLRGAQNGVGHDLRGIDRGWWLGLDPHVVLGVLEVRRVDRRRFDQRDRDRRPLLL